MKIIDKWTDKLYDSTNSLFEFPNGFRLLHTIKPQIKDFNVDLILLGGSYFEDQIGVPKGTAHFLEHMLLNPNEKFKSKKEIDVFKFGTRTSPEVFTNASTGHKEVDYFGYTKSQSATKLLELLKLYIDYPLNKFDEYIEKERGVILAELQNYKKQESDSGFAYDKFFILDIYPEFFPRVIGNEESIKSVSVEDLIKYWSIVKNPKNSIIAIQSSKALPKSLLRKIEQIAQIKTWSTSDSVKIKKLKMPNEFKFKHFKDDQEQGIFFSSNFFYKTNKPNSHFEYVLSYIARSLIYFVAFNNLREEQGIIYSVSTFSYTSVWDYITKGYSLSLEKNNLEKALDSMYEVLFSKLSLFLESEEGKKWFESKISNYIFVGTENYDGDYSRNIAIDILRKERDYKYDYYKSVEVAKKITAKEVMQYIKQNYLDTPQGYWFVSPYEDNEIYSIFKKSKFYKHYKK